MLKTRLKELRKRRNITQEQLAEAIGLERSSIGKYEGNQGVVPSIDVLNSISDFFNVSTDYLLGRDNKYNQVNDNVNLNLTVSESVVDYFHSFHRKEFAGLTKTEIDKLAIYAEGLKAGRKDDAT